MEELIMSYTKCICQNCGRQYATMIEDDEELRKEACPHCGKRLLQLTAPLSFTEMSSLFFGGG